MKIISIVGARPNFMKIAPIIKEFSKYIKNGYNLEHMLVHTGQHYSPVMSEMLFNQLGLPEPDINLGIGSGSHGEQTGKIIIEFEKVLQEYKPDLIIVVGDVNSTIACALDAKKLGIKVAHVEAGLRSFDMNMPEEINRILTDAISDFLFITEKSAITNLSNEGVNQEKVHFVGNVMIDTLLSHLEKAKEKNTIEELGISNNEYVVVTLHRPSNVDNKCSLESIGNVLAEISKNKTIVFPVHPRTQNKINEYNLDSLFSKENNILLTEPLPYLEFINIISGSYAVLTDSGGLQEETTVMGIPCLTLRENTERPSTIHDGTNKLVGLTPSDILNAYNQIAKNAERKIPEKWDGKAAERIVRIILEKFSVTTA